MSKTKVTSTFQLDPKIAKKLDSKSRKLGVPKVRIVNLAIQDFLENNKRIIV